MRTVTSADGTTIAYSRQGSGPVIVFLGGAFNDRTACAPVADALRDSYTVVCVDRRGRGDSGDVIAPREVARYEIRREVEDLDAVIAAEGGSAAVFGFSSGGILALHAAVAGSAIGALALYEPPFALGGLAGSARDLTGKLAELVAAGRRGDAVATMQIEGIGLPPAAVDDIRRSPMWPQLEAVAQTVVYDAALTAAPNLPTEAMRALEVDTLVLAGAETWPGLRSAASALPDHLPRARYAEIPGGAGHGIPAEATARAVDEFLRGK
ncbi:alpha/beta fold hydrolase [Amycolatopsis thermophila]|uniref:Pimeloyl-ACP methyl ester carboxylesterase n=1 Tax=Amycolatopsis thermophila TaxID=206084 RepID=A0ABU0EZG0_9PSEU|nr:alpha/beta hydrolase [Amycolatopsis thermophila]MDQ0380528.1 pimeloyl-ACP methyl ester carboxylesterase [Amycolatopsis thermophila]